MVVTTSNEAIDNNRSTQKLSTIRNVASPNQSPMIMFIINSQQSQVLKHMYVYV